MRGVGDGQLHGWCRALLEARTAVKRSPIACGRGSHHRDDGGGRRVPCCLKRFYKGWLEVDIGINQRDDRLWRSQLHECLHGTLRRCKHRNFFSVDLLVMTG